MFPWPPSSYGSFSGFIFIFNLIVGTGALALPAAMLSAGYLLRRAPLLRRVYLSYTTVQRAALSYIARVKCRRGGGRGEGRGR